MLKPSGDEAAEAIHDDPARNWSTTQPLIGTDDGAETMYAHVKLGEYAVGHWFRTPEEAVNDALASQ